jgi:hypothetical protein
MSTIPNPAFAIFQSDKSHVVNAVKGCGRGGDMSASGAAWPESDGVGGLRDPTSSASGQVEQKPPHDRQQMVLQEIEIGKAIRKRRP